MTRGRAWRRYKNYTKAKRKRDIDFHDMYWWNYKKSNNSLDFSSEVGIYHNLHQYSKNKIHCSCSICSGKTNMPKYRHGGKCEGMNYTIKDYKRYKAMEQEIKEYEQENEETAA